MSARDHPEKLARRPATSAVPTQRLERASGRRGPRCQALRRDGAPCGASASLASGGTKCFFHDEAVSPDRKLDAVTRGGLASTRQYVIPTAPDPDLTTPEAIGTAIRETAGQVKRGELAPSVGVALTGLYNASLRAFEANVWRRVEELERVAGAHAQQRRWGTPR